MELRLPGKVQARAALEALHRRARELLHGETGAPGGVELFVEIALVFVGREKQVAAHAAEPGVDPFLFADAFDLVDRRAMALGGEARALVAVQPDHLGVAVVDHRREVGGRHAGLAVPGRAVVDQGDRSPFSAEEVGGRDAGDAGADDADVHIEVVVQGRPAAFVGGIQPDGVAFHNGWSSKALTGGRTGRVREDVLSLRHGVGCGRSLLPQRNTGAVCCACARCHLLEQPRCQFLEAPRRRKQGRIGSRIGQIGSETMHCG
jgi:hypothetical protein